jgi:hypothetical protein
MACQLVEEVECPKQNGKKRKTQQPENDSHRSHDLTRHKITYHG